MIQTPIPGLPALPCGVEVYALGLRGTCWAVRCLVCGGGGQAVTVQTVTADHEEDARGDAYYAARAHHEQHQRDHARVLDEIRWEGNAKALTFSRLQITALVVARRGHLHRDQAGYYCLDESAPMSATTRGRTVKAVRVEGLARGGYVRGVARDDHGRYDVILSPDGADALAAWEHLSPEPVPDRQEAEPAPWPGGEEEARRREVRARQAEVLAAELERTQAQTAAAIAESEERYAAEQAVRERREQARAWWRRIYEEEQRERDVWPRVAEPRDVAYDAWYGDALLTRLTALRAAAELEPGPEPEPEPEGAAAVDEATGGDQEGELAPHRGETVWDVMAESGTLPLYGPGLVAPGMLIEYLPGWRPGPRARHPHGGVIVSVGRRTVRWRPAGMERTVRTSMYRMRIDAPMEAVTPEASGEAGEWRTWSLARHRQEAAARTTTTRQRKARAETAGQLGLWPAGASAAETEPGTPVPSRVVVIPCSAGKQQDRAAAPAGELYTGSLHRACRRAADALTTAGDQTVILSARYGLVGIDEVIEPYDMTITDEGAVTADQLRAQARRLGIEQAGEVIVLASAAYTAAALAVWPDATTPLAGSRGIGVMRSRLAHIAATGDLAEQTA